MVFFRNSEGDDVIYFWNRSLRSISRVERGPRLIAESHEEEEDYAKSGEGFELEERKGIERMHSDPYQGNQPRAFHFTSCYYDILCIPFFLIKPLYLLQERFS